MTVADVFREQSLPMTLVHSDEVIRQIPPAACSLVFRHIRDSFNNPADFAEYTFSASSNIQFT